MDARPPWHGRVVSSKAQRHEAWPYHCSFTLHSFLWQGVSPHMQPSQLFFMSTHKPPLVLGCVGSVRANPHLLLVLVSYCRLCEEDVGMYDCEKKTLHVAKLNLTVSMQVDGSTISWQGMRVPSTFSISTQPQPLAMLPSQGTAVLITPAHPNYPMVYRHHCCALARYTDCTRFESGIRNCWLQECLSWLTIPPALQPPLRRPPNGHVNL